MKALELSNATRRLGAPKGWDHTRDGICHTLDICDRDGFMISAWQLTAAEKLRLLDGNPLFLAIQGTCHPVVSLSVGAGIEKAASNASGGAGGEGEGA